MVEHGQQLALLRRDEWVGVVVGGGPGLIGQAGRQLLDLRRLEQPLRPLARKQGTHRFLPGFHPVEVAEGVGPQEREAVEAQIPPIEAKMQRHGPEGIARRFPNRPAT